MCAMICGTIRYDRVHDGCKVYSLTISSFKFTAVPFGHLV